MIPARQIASSVTVVLLLAGTPARANDDALSEADKAAAAQYFKEGERLFEEGSYAAAAEAFTRAYEIAPHPAVLPNIGLSHERAGNSLMALKRYKEFLATAEMDDATADEIWSRIETLEASLGVLEISCPEGGCTITVDGEEQPIPSGETSVSVTVEPGRHLVEGSGLSGAYRSVNIDVAAQQFKSVILEVDAPLETVEPEPEPEPEPVDEGIRLGAPFFVATGVAVAGGIGIVAFGTRTLKASDTYEESGRLDEKAKRTGEDSKLATNVMIGITSVAAAAAVAFAIYDLGFKDKKGESEVAVAPLIGPAPGIAVAGEF